MRVAKNHLNLIVENQHRSSSQTSLSSRISRSQTLFASINFRSLSLLRYWMRYSWRDVCMQRLRWSRRSIIFFRLVKMKVCNLNYNQELQLIICIEHDICVALKFLRKHLQRSHEIKENSLRATLIEVSQLHVRDSWQINAFVNNFFIFYLSIDIEYRCEYIACNEEKNALNKHKRAMKKHLTKKHNIDHAKEKTQLTFNDVQMICVQSFCTSDKYRLFVVHANEIRNDISTIFFVEDSSSQAMIFSHAINEVFDSMRMKLEQKYERNQQNWKFIFERFQFITNSYANQTSSWLRIIDISRWMTKLYTNKKKLRELLHANSNDEFFFMTTSRTFQLIACNKCYRASNTLLDRSSDAS